MTLNILDRKDNMDRFESGVASYIVGEAAIRVFFPVDNKGRAFINCKQCQFLLISNERMCQLEQTAVAYPGQYVGVGTFIVRLTERRNEPLAR